MSFMILTVLVAKNIDELPCSLLRSTATCLVKCSKQSLVSFFDVDKTAKNLH